MSNKKDNAFEKISQEFEALSKLIISQLALLEKLISIRDNIKMGEVLIQLKETESVIDMHEVKISNRIIRTISLYSPIAGDLRRLMAIYRMSINLERIGDYIINVANFVIRIPQPELFFSNSDQIEHMLTLTTNMVNRALFSFSNEDKDYAIWTIKSDDVIDELNHKMLMKSLNKENIGHKEQNLFISYFDILSIVSNIERIADHATNIAEASIFAIEGKDIRHQKFDEESEDPDFADDTDEDNQDI